MGRMKTLFLTGLFLLVPGLARAAGDMSPLVHDIGWGLLLAGVLAVVFTKLKIPTIAAFLVAGVIVGPLGAELVTVPENIDTIAQLGLTLLLFLIGLELDFKKLLASGKTLILTGILQFPLCIALGFGAAKLLVLIGFGSGVLDGRYAPLYVGFALAASSTLLVVKLFQENFQLDTLVGSTSLGILIFQDIWAIIVIALQPNFDNPKILPILLSFVGIAILAAFSHLLARYVISRGFRWIAKLPEVILLAALAWCFVVVFLGMNLDLITEKAFGLNFHLAVSSGMGALIAGATVASLPYAVEIVGKVSVVKDFFVTLFFVALGMGIPRPDSITVLILALLLALLAIAARYLVFFPLLYFTGLDRRSSFVASTRLAQISEFTLVIMFLGLKLNHIDPNLNSAIIFAFVITALLTPILYKKADKLHDAIGPVLTKIGVKTPPEEEAEEEEVFDIALLGFHRVASSLIHGMSVRYPEHLKSTLVVDFNVAIHPEIERRGITVRYGDLTNSKTLEHTGVGEARVVICTIPDDLLKGTSNRKLVHTIRKMNPSAVIIANAVELEESRLIYDSGADYVYTTRVEMSHALLELLEQALAGNIASHRDSMETAHGKWHERDEVLN